MPRNLHAAFLPEQAQPRPAAAKLVLPGHVQVSSAGAKGAVDQGVNCQFVQCERHGHDSLAADPGVGADDLVAPFRDRLRQQFAMGELLQVDAIVRGAHQHVLGARQRAH